MQAQLVIPAQIRAARALLDWSQEQLAEAAEVALSSVRDTESQKRPADSAAASAIRRALENAGVVFVPGDPHNGPGVRLVANRPSLIRRPTIMTMWDGMPFNVEWQGREVTVFLSKESVEDLGGLAGIEPVAEYFKVFEAHRGEILDAVGRAIQDSANFDRDSRLHLRSKDLPSLQ